MMDSGSVFLEDILSDTSFGALHVSGAANLSGALQIVLPDGFIPTNGLQIILLSAGAGLNGMFSSAQGLNFGPGGIDQWALSYGADQVILTANIANAAPVAEPASFILISAGLICFGVVRMRSKSAK